MNYIEIEVSEWGMEKPSLIQKILEKFIPAANPDTEELIKQCKYWWLEYDESGIPQREIGFNENKKPIVLGPVGKNMGFLVDSSDNWLNFKEPSKEVALKFEETWDSLWPEFNYLEKNS